jgi:predicted transcriptional regulator
MRKALTPLGETEMEVLHHVWELQNASVANVHDRIRETRKVAYTTIMTVMKNLSNKGYLAFSKEGLTYVYYPLRKPMEVQHALVSGLLQRVFKGSVPALIQALVMNEVLSENDKRDIIGMIDSL